MSTEPIRAKRAAVELSKNLIVDGYEMPSGEHRVGSTGVSLLLGYAKNYFSKVTVSSPKQLRALQEKGFQGYLVEALTERDDRHGASKVKTLSKSDFKIWVEFEATRGNKHALALSHGCIFQRGT